MRAELQECGIPYIHANYSRGRGVNVGYIGFPVDESIIGAGHTADAYGLPSNTNIVEANGNIVARMIKEVAPEANIYGYTVKREGQEVTLPSDRYLKKFVKKMDIILFDAMMGMSLEDAKRCVDLVNENQKVAVAALVLNEYSAFSVIPGVFTCATTTKKTEILDNTFLAYGHGEIQDEAGAFAAGVMALYLPFLKHEGRLCIPLFGRLIEDVIRSDRSTKTKSMLVR